MPRRQDDGSSWRPHDTDRSIDPFDGPARGVSRPVSPRSAARPPVPPLPSRPSAGDDPAARTGSNRPGTKQPGAKQPGTKQPGTKQPGTASSSRLPSQGRRYRPTGLRTPLLAGGAVLAVGATLLVFLTDNPDLLRVAVVAAAWAFVLATLVAGRRRADETAAEGRETALRRAYEHQLEREVAARREFELELENEVRREAEEAMRAEIDALREDLAGLAALREEVSRVADLKDDVASLTALRAEVARVAALRDDVLALTALRTELGQVGELRADLGRLRAELTEQLSSEMLVERIVMRTQAGRLDAAPSWREDPPRELTGGWPAVRLDESPATQQYPATPQRHSAVPQYPGTQQYPVAQQFETTTQQFERIRVDRPMRAWEPATGGFAMPAAQAPAPAVSAPTPAPPPAAQAPAPQPAPLPVAEPPAWMPVAPATEGYGLPDLPARRSRHSAAADDDAEPLPTSPPPSPVEWLAARSLLDEPATQERPRPSPRRRRTDDDDPLAHPLLPPRPEDARTTERPAAPAPSSSAYPFGAPAPLPQPEPAGPEPAVPGPAAPGPAAGTGSVRVDQILADSGVTPATGSRRRRRYREDDGSDDVLSRVLRGG